MSNLVLPPDHYIVPCSYAPLPSMMELKRTFKGGVRGAFEIPEGWEDYWRKHAIVILEGEEPGEKIVWVAKPPKELLGNSEKIIAWGYQCQTEVAPNGYYPIMGHNQLLDLHRAYPELYKEHKMSALGSFTYYGEDNSRSFVVLCADDHNHVGEPELNVTCDDLWGEEDWFPFVARKSKSFSRS